MKLRINDGSRPSQLSLGRHVAGETSMHVSFEELQSYVNDIHDTSVAPFNHDALLARAFAMTGDGLGTPSLGSAPAWTRRLGWIASALAVAAALFLLVRPPPPPRHGNNLKGTTNLDFYVLRDGQPYPGDPSLAVRPGDRLQFTYRSGDADHMVLIGVDGTGRFEQFYPDEGSAAVAVVPGERHVLEGSILLDDAPGPEVFVAFFGDETEVDVGRALDRAERAWRADGADGLVALAAEDADVAVLVLEKE